LVSDDQRNGLVLTQLDLGREVAVLDRISEAERQRIAELVAEGAPVWKLNLEINRSRHAIRRVVVAFYRPAKKEPVRSRLRLSLAEREEISRGLAAGESMRAVAGRLGRAPSTVCREIKANGGPRRYRAHEADRRAVRRLRRPKPAKLAQCPRLREVVEAKLELRWSPQQIAAWLKTAYPDDPEMRVSHETIYLSLFVQARGALRKELFRCLRTGRARRRPQGLTVMNGQGKIRNAVSISERPAEASDRAVPGHWEGDLVYGKSYSAIATLVERKSRFVMLVQLPGGHTAYAVAGALSGAVVTLPAQLRRSLTWDQGKEMAEHARFTIATKVPVYFCDPHSPWQRGSNENTNGLLRQYFPRRTDFRTVTQSDLDRVAAELNGRPRQTLQWRTPCQALDEALR
jgi:transposase, IS30 family